MTSQRDMVQASLNAEHDHGCYARRKTAGRRAEDQPKVRECGEPYAACSRFIGAPPLGLVPYLPTHNHEPGVLCAKGCPWFDWTAHVVAHGNPYGEAGR